MKKFYHPELDRLRFVAFLVVFLHHFFPQDPSSYKKLGTVTASVLASFVTAGGLGVDLFFCLSSFLITSLLVREHDARGTIDVRAFWIRRILRIWPLYYFFIAFTVIVVPMLLHKDDFGVYYLLGFVLLSGNWVCVANGYPSSVAAPLWSVSIEEQFYLAWPLLLSFLSIRRLPHLALACLFVASAVRVCMVLLGLPHPSIWCNTLARLDPIAIGALFAVFSHHRKYAISSTTRLLLLIASILLPPALIFTFGFSCFSGASSLFFYPLVALCCGFILIACFKNNGEGARIEERSGMRHWWSGTLVYLGRISYGLYVFHVLSIHLSKTITVNQGAPLSYKVAGFAGQLIMAFGLTVALASASYFLLEKPFLRFKARFTYVESTPINQVGESSGDNKDPQLAPVPLQPQEGNQGDRCA